MGNEQQLTVQQCVEVNQAIGMITSNGNLNLSVMARYRLARLHSRVSKVAETYEESHRKMIVEKYGVADGKGNFSVPKEKYEAYQNEAFMLLAEKEMIQVPELPFSFFEHEEIPYEFFRLMGDLITE